MIFKCIGPRCHKIKPGPPHRASGEKPWLCPTCAAKLVKRHQRLERETQRKQDFISRVMRSTPRKDTG